MKPDASLHFSEELIKDLEAIVQKYENKRAALLPVLHRVQEEYGCISEPHEISAANFLELPIVQVREVISFYGMFHQKPLGQHHIKVCQTLSCCLTGQPHLLNHLKDKLGVEAGETTADKKFTLSTVECLGACEIAPMMQIDKDNYGPLTPEKIDKILEDVK